MVYMDFSVIAVWLAVGIAVLALGFGKRSGLLVLLGGLLVMLVPVLVDGLNVSGATVETVTTETPVSVFSDDYTTNSGWTQVGTLVTVDSASADKLYMNLSSSTGDRRVYKALGSTLSDTDFTADFDFVIVSGGAGNFITPVFALTASNGDPTVANQDGIFMSQKTSTNNGVHLAYKDGASAAVDCVTTPNALSLGVTYYARMVRISSVAVQLEIYSNSARTSLVGGFPQVCVIPSTITGLSYIQHGANSAQTKTLALSVDNTSISGVDVEEVTTTTGQDTEDFPPLMRFLIGFVGIVFIGVGLGRYGFSL